MTGAELIASSISSYGTKTVFALAGALHTPLLAQLDADGFRIIGNRSESAVVESADGYARVTGRPGVGLIIATQGAVNSVAGFATAYEAGSPVVVIVATPPREDDDPWHGSYRRSSEMVGPFCKWQREVRSPNLLPEYVRAALLMATTGRPGPVALSVPADFFSLTMADDAGIRPTTPANAQSGPLPSPTDAAAAVDLIRRAKRPVVLAGSGVRRSGAFQQLGRFVEKFRLPVLLEGPARGGLREDYGLVFPWAVAQTAMVECDAVLVLGCRLGPRLGWGRPPRFSADAEFIQVDIVAEELGRGRSLSVGIVADVAAALAGLEEALDRVGYVGEGGGWLRERLGPRLKMIESVADETEGGLHPYAVARQLNEQLRGPVIYVGDGADVQTWMQGALRVEAGSMWLDHRPLGSMGVGLPLALGACAGEQELAADGAAERPVVLVGGDGSLGYHLCELETASRCGLPLRVFVSNDGAWGTEKHGQLKKIGKALNTDLSAARYDLVAQGLGCGGYHVTDERELESATTNALAGNGPTLVNVVVDPNSGALRKSEPLLEMHFYDEIALTKAQAT